MTIPYSEACLAVLALVEDARKAHGLDYKRPEDLLIALTEPCADLAYDILLRLGINGVGVRDFMQIESPIPTQRDNTTDMHKFKVIEDAAQTWALRYNQIELEPYIFLIALALMKGGTVKFCFAHHKVDPDLIVASVFLRANLDPFVSSDY